MKPGQTTLLVLIIAIALAIRALGIEARPIWYDEAFSLLLSEKGPAVILAGTLSTTGGAAADIHPPAYYFNLWVWINIFGQSVLAARFLSILASLLSIVVGYCLAKDVFNSRVAFLSAALLAIAPFQVHYGQEIRMYSFLTLWLIAAVYAYWKGAATHKTKWWILFAISTALAQYTHNLSVFFLVPLALSPLWKQDWKTLRSVILAGIAAALLYLPWLIHLPNQFMKIQHGYWIERPGFERIMTLLLSFVTNLPLPGGWLLPGLSATLFIVAISLWQTIRFIRDSTTQKLFIRADKALWMLYLAFAPALLLFLISQWRPVYIERGLVASGAIFWIWVAWVLSETRLPKAMLVLTVFAILSGAGIGIYQHLTYQNFPYAPYRIINEHIRERFTLGDVIIHSNKLTMLPALYYSPDLPQTFIADPPVSGTDTLDQATQSALGISAAPNIHSASGKAGRIWLIIFARAIDEYQHDGYATHPHLAWLDQN